MEEGKTSSVLDRVKEVLSGQVFPALREGGLLIPLDEVIFELFLGMWSGNVRRLMLIDITNEHNCRLFVTLVVPPDEDPKNPEVAQIYVDLTFVGGKYPAGVMFTRRTDGPWKAWAGGTHELPKDHAIRNFAHDTRHLGITQRMMSTELDDHQVFQAITKAARLHRHNTL